MYLLMKKVLILHNYTEDSFAAMSYHLANDLSAKGHDVLFLSHRPYHPEPKKINDHLTVQCWASHRRPTWQLSNIWLFTRLYFSFRPDIVIAHFAGENLALILSKLYSFGKVHTYNYYHTLTAQLETDFVAGGQKQIQQLRYRFLVWRKRLFYRIFCNYVMATSKLACADFERIYRLPNGMSHVTPISDRFTGAVIDPSGPLRVSYLGRLDPSKGIDRLLEAVRELKSRFGADIRFEFAGRGHYEQELQQLQAEGLVEYAGFLDYDKVDSFLERNHVFVIPSYADNLVTVGIEAMMKQRCLVISTATGLSHYLTHGKDCLQIQTDTASITSALVYLMENRMVPLELAAGGRQTYLNTFSVPSYLAFMNQFLPLRS